MPRRHPQRGNHGSATQVILWIVVAVSIFATVANRLFREGASDIGFIVAMSVAAVIAIAIVAPRRFKSIRGATSDWKDDFEYKPRSGIGGPPPQGDQSSNTAPNQKSRNDAA